MAFPQYRIPVERLKEEWASRIARNIRRKRRPPVPPSKIEDNSEPWIREPHSINELECLVSIVRSPHSAGNSGPAVHSSRVIR